MKASTYFTASRKVLVAVGLIFILNGLFVGGVNAVIRSNVRGSTLQQKQNPNPYREGSVLNSLLRIRGSMQLSQ